MSIYALISDREIFGNDLKLTLVPKVDRFGFVHVLYDRYLIIRNYTFIPYLWQTIWGGDDELILEPPDSSMSPKKYRRIGVSLLLEIS